MAASVYGVALVPSTRQAMEGEKLAKAAGLAVTYTKFREG